MAAAPSVPAAQQPQQQVSDFGRVGGVLFSPGATFTDIARKPSWIVPVVLMTVVSLFATYFLNQKMDWASFIRTQAEKSSRFQNLSPEDQQRAVETQAKFSVPIAWVIGTCGVAFYVVVISAVQMLAFNILSGAQLRYKTAFGIVAYAFLPGGLIGGALLAVVLMLKRYGDVDPQRMLATSLVTLLPGDAPSWQLSLASSIELFWIWSMILMAIGYNKANPKKISMGTACGMVIGLWALYVLCRTGLALAFS